MCIRDRVSTQSTGDIQITMADAAPKKRSTFRKYTYRGVDLENLVHMSIEELLELMHARARRRFKHKPPHRYFALRKRLRVAKKNCNTAIGEKPVCIKTHLRDAMILPDMIGSVVGVYNGKTFNQVEIKADMVGHYLAEFSMSYKPVKHGTAGIGATKSSRFVPLK
eukprot:TRINITY_DN11031_c0_g1_i5.p2 TRINITY_DN11031_c0_g1~~TRINITY_DN11031_c0_g1_i5.p2  ORF type:complete len:166 (-),score=48.58 TRINITY_DN11031_c0_g1_i5:127-624(-)